MRDGLPVRAGRALHHRHLAAARRRAFLPDLLRPGRSRRERASAPRRLDLPARRLAVGAWPAPPLVCMGWHPEQGFIRYDWTRLRRGDDRLHPRARLADASGRARGVGRVDARRTNGGSFYGQPHVEFAPLFGHQYSHVWIDFRGIQDAYMRGKGIDYFENSRRATLRAAALRDRQSHAVERLRRATRGGSRASTGRATPT